MSIYQKWNLFFHNILLWFAGLLARLAGLGPAKWHKKNSTKIKKVPARDIFWRRGSPQALRQVPKRKNLAG